jgi:hypothetical protein
MKYVKPMNCKEFAEYLLTLKTGDTVEFGTDIGPLELDELEEAYAEDPGVVECWYFARVIEIKEYGSRFILLDYAGGEEAFAIPLNGYKNTADDDDKEIVPGYVELFFENNNNIVEYVYVEMEEAL